MELSLLTKFRIAAVAVVGMVVIGVLAWPLAAPAEPLGAVLAGNIGFGEAIVLGVLAIVTGFVSYFLAWPYGREIGVLAVPAGLVIWAVRSGSMAELILLNPGVVQRQELFASLKWGSIFWLIIVAAGFVGVLIGQKVCGGKAGFKESRQRPNSRLNRYLNAAVAVAGSGLIALFCVSIFAQDVRMFDGRFGSVVAQPDVKQIVFAVLVSFGIAAFVVKKFLDVSYIWPIVACLFITPFSISVYANQTVLEYFAEYWPIVFFSNSVISILPVQMVSFGALGSIGGYWLAVRYDYWRRHEV